MSTKLAKLEQMIADLEKRAGLNPTIEAVLQHSDGTWPDPVTGAPLVVERLNFKLHPELRELRRKNLELQDKVAREREHLERAKRSPVGRRTWRPDDAGAEA